MKPQVYTNKVEQYLIDERLVSEVDVWLRDVNGGKDSIESFMEHFPNDPDVVLYREKQDTETWENLITHVELVKSRLPLEKYFDTQGLGKDYQVSKLKSLLECGDKRVEMQAYKQLMTLAYPENKPKIIQPVQQNNYYFTEDERKERLVSGLRNLLNDNNTD